MILKPKIVEFKSYWCVEILSPMDEESFLKKEFWYDKAKYSEARVRAIHGVEAPIAAHMDFDPFVIMEWYDSKATSKGPI